MAAKDRILSALNFLTGEGISYYPTGIEEREVLVVIENYFNTPESGNESSDDASDHNDESDSNTDKGLYKIMLWHRYAYLATPT